MAVTFYKLFQNPICLKPELPVKLATKACSLIGKVPEPHVRRPPAQSAGPACRSGRSDVSRGPDRAMDPEQRGSQQRDEAVERRGFAHYSHA